MNVVDIAILIILLIFIAKGFSNGAVKETVSFVGGIAVIVIAYLLKNPVSVFLYQVMPFFKFSGLIMGITVLNIVIYELFAFLLVAAILMTVYQVIVKMTSVFETLLKLTFVLALPSKLLGALVGAIEGIIVTFLLLFACVQVDSTRKYVDESKFGHEILTKTPIMSTAVSPIYDSLKEIYEVADNYKGSSDRDAANLECLEVLLKYKVLTSENADVLVENGKLKMPGVDQVIDKYRKTT